jgi:pSer/pThr/pTyr-binding forkhead associated (FHA) protein
MTLRIEGTDRQPEQVVQVERPFALAGLTEDADVRLSDHAVNARHAYLHLDSRGLYVVDLATRTGTRLNGADQTAGWLRPGDWFEIAGRRIAVDALEVDGEAVDPTPRDDDLLADPPERPVVPLALLPSQEDEAPWTASSELIFLGSSTACGIRIKDPAVSRIHCVLYRTASTAYVIALDLHGQHTRVDGRVVDGATALTQGATLTLGGTSFTVRLGPDPAPGSAPLVAHVIDAELVENESEGEREDRDDASTELVRAAAQPALLAWIVSTIQETQGTVLRQQSEMHATLAQMLHQIQHDNAALLNAHLERIERIDGELAAIRAELERRQSDSPPAPSPPQVPPLRIERQLAPPTGTTASTTWLLDRIGQLEHENRSAWKDLLGRLSTSPRRVP